MKKEELNATRRVIKASSCDCGDERCMECYYQKMVGQLLDHIDDEGVKSTDEFVDLYDKRDSWRWIAMQLKNVLEGISKELCPICKNKRGECSSACQYELVIMAYENEPVT